MKPLLHYLFPPPAPVFRDAGTHDAGHLAQIHARAFRRGWGPDEFERLLADKVVRAHVVSQGARAAPVGFVLSHVIPPEAEILSIAVRTDRRGTGLGKALLQHHLARLAAAGVTISFLEVEEANVPALRLYQSFGYQVVGRRKGYYGDAAADALMLRRDF